MPENNNNQNSSPSQNLTDLFDQIEPFIVNIFREQKQLTLRDTLTFPHIVVDGLTKCEPNEPKQFFSLLEERIKKEVDLYIEYLKKFPVDDKLIKYLEEELQKVEIAYQRVYCLFKPINFLLIAFNLDLKSCCFDYFATKLFEELDIEKLIMENN